jgi:hypothetical protein
VYTIGVQPISTTTAAFIITASTADVPTTLLLGVPYPRQQVRTDAWRRASLCIPAGTHVAL